MKLYEYAILHRQKARKDRDGNDVPEVLTVVQPVKHTTAPDERAVLLAAAREIPDLWVGRLQEVEIAVRPF